MAEIIKDKGDVVRLTVAFANTEGTMFDPTTLDLKVRSPGLDILTPTPISAGTGQYYADVTLYQSGMWTYKWQSIGLGAGTEEGVIFARPTSID